MNNIKFLSFSKIANFSVVFLMLLAFTSCEEDDEYDYSDLSIHVSGTLSGKSRSGLKVALYNSKEDADNEVDSINLILTTDNEGWVTYSDLERGTRYWVRVDTTLIHNIKLSDTLKSGDNEMEIRIL